MTFYLDVAFLQRLVVGQGTSSRVLSILSVSPKQAQGSFTVRLQRAFLFKTHGGVSKVPEPYRASLSDASCTQVCSEHFDGATLVPGIRSPKG